LWHKFILVFAVFPIAIFVNVLRITVIGAGTHFYGTSFAESFFHELSGLLLFLVAGLLFAGLALILSWLERLNGSFRCADRQSR
jgi:exosortase/archaeosortase family protein